MSHYSHVPYYKQFRTLPQCSLYNLHFNSYPPSVFHNAHTLSSPNICEYIFPYPSQKHLSIAQHAAIYPKPTHFYA
jgi:hypothetical protein